MTLVAALMDKPDVTLRDKVARAVLPIVLHLIDLGTPSWYAQFMTQALVEPSLREYSFQSHLAYCDRPKRTFDTCATSPCVRLSRTPWPVVTPATTIRTP